VHYGERGEQAYEKSPPPPFNRLYNTLAHADRIKSRRVDPYRDEMTLSRLLMI
jgi:hypothetical protein